MPELDYAFIAEYAKVDQGTITAVGASYTDLAVQSFPATHMLYVAGRVRSYQSDPEPTLSVSVTPPDESFVLSAIGVLPRGENSIVYNDKVGTVFALSTPLTIQEPGLYTVRIEIDGQDVRRLAFSANLQGL